MNDSLLNHKYQTSDNTMKSRIKQNILEQRLKIIFENEINSENSVIVKYNSEIIEKAAMFLSGIIARSASIGIAGETASGKSTVTFDIINTLNAFANEFKIDNLITRVNSDDYYYDRSQQVKQAGGMSNFSKTYDFDVPEALELSLMKKHIEELLKGKSVMLPEYDMSGTTIRRDNVRPAFPSKIIISEGLFTLTEEIKDAFDFKIYVHVTHEVQKERFFKRANERGLGEGAMATYTNALNKAKIYIRPAYKYADIVISGNADRSLYKNFINRLIFAAQEVNSANLV